MKVKYPFTLGEQTVVLEEECDNVQEAFKFLSTVSFSDRCVLFIPLRYDFPTPGV